MFAANKDKDDTIYKDFHSDEHHGLHNIETCTPDLIKLMQRINLLAKEVQWAYGLRSVRPEGLNERDFFFSQNRENEHAINIWLSL